MSFLIVNGRLLSSSQYLLYELFYIGPADKEPSGEKRVAGVPVNKQPQAVFQFARLSELFHLIIPARFFFLK